MVTDAAWAEVARETRRALYLLGYKITPVCLPDEPEACGGTYAEHAAAHLAAIKAVADHQLGHLRPPDGLVETTYEAITHDLDDHGGCHLPEGVT